MPLLLFSMFFNYAVALLIHRWRGQRGARVAVVTGVAVNLLLLGILNTPTSSWTFGPGEPPARRRI